MSNEPQRQVPIDKSFALSPENQQELNSLLLDSIAANQNDGRLEDAVALLEVLHENITGVAPNPAVVAAAVSKRAKTQRSRRAPTSTTTTTRKPTANAKAAAAPTMSLSTPTEKSTPTTSTTTTTTTTTRRSPRKK